MEKMGTALVIDDEVEICLLLKGFLRRKFKHVEIANTLEDGLNKAKLISPDILFLDNNLPDGQGIDNIKTFRSFVDKIVIISAMTNLSDTAMKAGASYFLGKPISFKSIEEVL